MSKFRKRPVVIEAEQFWPELKPWPAGVEESDTVSVWGPTAAPATTVHIIRTMEGPHCVTPGDWVITGVKGERYPCNPEIFEATYEAVE